MISTALFTLTIFFVSDTATAQETETEIVGSATVGFLCSGMRGEPTICSDIILEMDQGDGVQVHDFYEQPYLKVSVDSITGYASTSCFESNSTISSVKYADNPRLLSLIKEFGKGTALKIDKGEIWVGMTEDMLIKSKGRPSSKNITKTAYGNSEQWVYDKSNYRADYVYLRNGKVETIQISE